MLCEKCGKNNATTHIRSVVNGVVTEKHLCACCAANEGYSDMQGNNLTQLLSSMFGDIMAANSSMGAVRCKCCGGAFADIAESGKVVCPECYKTFYNELLPYLKRVHGSTKHIGKIPNKAPLAVKADEETVEGLRMLLNQLVREENYEQAAVVRDKIKKLEVEGK